MYEILKKCTICHSPFFVDKNMQSDISIWQTCYCPNFENLNQPSEYMLVLVVMLCRKEPERLVVDS